MVGIDRLCMMLCLMVLWFSVRFSVLCMCLFLKGFLFFMLELCNLLLFLFIMKKMVWILGFFSSLILFCFLRWKKFCGGRLVMMLILLESRVVMWVGVDLMGR